MLRVALAALVLSLVGSTVVAGRPAADPPRTLRPTQLPLHRTSAPPSLRQPAAPAAYLFVAASCPHCVGVSRYADSLRLALGVPLVIVSLDPPDVAESWRGRTRLLAPVIADTARALRRALLIQYVPTLVTIDRQHVARTVVGAGRRVDAREALESLRQ